MASSAEQNLGPIEEFDYLIWGNEPAGIWLLQRLQAALENRGESARLGWLQTSPRSESVTLSFSQAKQFGIYPKARWSPELRFPRTLFRWEKYRLQERYPELDNSFFEDPLQPKAFLEESTRAFLRQILARYPEIYDEAYTVWSILGRAEPMRPEAILLAALKCSEVFHWDPEERLDEKVIRIRSYQNDQHISEVGRLRGRVYCFKQQNQRNILARHVIVNMPWWQARELAAPKIGAGLGLPEDPRAQTCLYPFSFTLSEGALPTVLQPFTLFSMADNLPMRNELFALQKNSLDSYTLWTHSYSELTVEKCLESFSEALRALEPIFPFLLERVESFAVAPRPEKLSPSERAACFHSLRLGSREIYARTSLSFQTKLPNLYCLGPWYQCYAPYPVGPLAGAQQLLANFLASREKKPGTHKSKPSKPDSRKDSPVIS